MRLLELDLLAYGAFTGARLDLTRSDALHVVYGPNEAGKSTTLRAVHALLYGIDRQTTDTYRHANADLRIGARLQSADGRELSFVRRKGNKGTLLGPAGDELADVVLTPFLCGVGRPMFEAMFGLDHGRLRAGGEQLRAGHGELGESLFQAGAGAASVQRVLQSLRAQHEAIYAPRGKRQLNEAIDAFDSARKRLSGDAVRAEVVLEQEQRVARLEEELTALGARRRELTAELSRLQRALEVLPVLARRTAHLTERQALGAVPELAVDAEAQRKELQQALIDSAREILRLGERAARLRDEEAALQITPSLEQESAELVRELGQRLAVHRSAALELPRRQAELRALEQGLATALGALPGTVAPHELPRLRLDAATVARIGKLGRERGALEARREQTEVERDAAAAQAARARRLSLQALVEPERGGIARTSPEPLRLEGLDGRMPSEETIASYAMRFVELERAAERFEGERSGLTQRAVRLATQLDALARSDAPPTEVELDAARTERDARLHGLRERATLDGRAELASVDALAADVQRADQLGDRMRREAARVAQRAEWLAEQTAVTEERTALEARVDERSSAAAALREAWRAAWSAAGITEGTPAEMRARRTGVLEALEYEERHAAAQRACEAARDALGRWQAQWTPLMAQLGLEPGAGGEEAQAVVDARREADTRAEQCEGLRRRIEGMERNAATLREDAGALVARHAPQLSSRSMEDAVEELLRLHALTKEGVGRRAHILAERRDLDVRVGEERARHDQAARALAALMQLARANSPEELEQEERRARRAHELTALVLACEQELLERGDGRSVEQLEGEVRGLDVDRARARRGEIEPELEQLHEEQPRLLQEKISVEGGLLHWRSRGAADAAAEVEQQLSRVRALALDFSRKRLAVELLERAIQRYRERNQGPVLKRAEALFTRLTLGNYPRLQVAYGEHDQPVLACIEASGRTVEVDRLSEGALDQLYLALRIASLERFAESAEPLPLLLDDVLVNFDDERAGAAFAVLGELAQKMQVLFFTHHAHHVELARAALGDERVVEHRLSRPASREATVAQP